MTTDKKRELRDLIDEVLKGRIDASRRLADEVLEKVQDRNRQYFLERLGYELRQLQLEEQSGDARKAMHHRVMADAYKSILERCFC